MRSWRQTPKCRGGLKTFLLLSGGKQFFLPAGCVRCLVCRPRFGLGRFPSGGASFFGGVSWFLVFPFLRFQLVSLVRVLPLLPLLPLGVGRGGGLLLLLARRFLAVVGCLSFPLGLLPFVRSVGSLGRAGALFSIVGSGGSVSPLMA